MRPCKCKRYKKNIHDNNISGVKKLNLHIVHMAIDIYTHNVGLDN